MPNTATPQTDPDGQALMKVLTDLGVTPGDAYNATQGVRNMAGQNVTARLEAKIETLGVELRAEIGQLSTKFDSLEGRIEGLEGTVEGLAPAWQVDGLTSQVDGLTSQVQSLTTQVEAHGVQLDALTTQVEAHGVQLQSLTSQTDLIASQVQSLVSLVEPLASQVSRLSVQVAALTGQVQGQAAQTHFTNYLLTLLVVMVWTVASMGFWRWFSDWRRARRLAKAGDSKGQSES